MKKAVIYTRVSTGRQADEGVSLSSQLEKARAWCLYNEYQIIGEFTDAGISGTKMKTRPGLLSALDLVCKEKAVLVAYSLSRLARSTKDAIAISERLEKAGANLASLTENLDSTTASGKMVFRMFAVIAEFLRDSIAENTKSALSHKVSRGEKIGGQVPYGFARVFSSDGTITLVVDPTEAQNITAMMIMKNGGSSFSTIARRLNDNNIYSKTGRKWSAKVVQDIIRQETKRREKA